MFRFNTMILLPLVCSCGASVQPQGPTVAPPFKDPSFTVDEKALPPSPHPLPVEQGLEPFRSTTLVGGLACLIRLKQLGISFKSLKTLKGVETPIRVTGSLGGINYQGFGKRPLICDCRLALALERAGPFLSQLGIQTVYFSGAYSYRKRPSGKLSRHAMGLAIDVHRVLAGDQLLKVKEDFELGRQDSCQGSSPTLNRMACLLKGWGVFDWVLTPDFDRAHYNHLHLSIYSLHRRRFVPKDTPPKAAME